MHGENLSAVLATLAEEAEMKRCPTAKGLYTFCATYRFVASVYLQADILLPHIARLSKVFQRPNVNFLHIKEQVCYDELLIFMFSFLSILCLSIHDTAGYD